MSCRVHSGGCERWAIEPFVSHFNRQFEANFKYESCLDVIERRTPQPECLYRDGDMGQNLVVERKSISWPADYQERHSNDHFLHDQIAKTLEDLNFCKLYTLRLPWLVSGKKNQLQQMALEIADHVRRHYLKLAPGRSIGSREKGRAWSFSISQPYEWEEYGDNATGIVYSRILNWQPEFLSPEDLPQALASCLTKIYDACLRKFADYQSARRVLLLDPYGQLFCDPEWWNVVFETYPPPAIIQEIWSGKFDWIDDSTEGWFFERLRS